MDATTGDNIRAERQRKRMSQADLATASGFSKSFISEIEQGRKSPRLMQLKQVATVLGVTVDSLIGLEVAAA